MTSLSGHRGEAGWNTAEFPLLARLSLHILVIAWLGVPSCLVTDSMEFPPPTETPPFLNLNEASATVKGSAPVRITRMVRIDDDTEQVTFTAPVQSEDNGRKLFARVFVDYQTQSGVAQRIVVGGGDELGASTFDDVRDISASLTEGNLAGLDPGCYQATLVVTHVFSSQTLLPDDQNDVGMAVFWMIKGDPDKVTMDTCPGVQPSPDVDSGLDGGQD